MRVGFGVGAGLPADLAYELAGRCAALGYSSLWTNDYEGGSGLEALVALAQGGRELEVGVGVLPMDRHSARAVAADIERLGLDPSRLWLGIGAGQAQPPLTVVRNAVAELRDTLHPSIRLVIGAMRPRMCALAATRGDGVLLNWMPAGDAARARTAVRDTAAEARRDPPPVLAYVRVAVGHGAADRLLSEETRYRRIDEGTRRYFEELGAPLGSVGIAAPDPASAASSLAAYGNAVDTVIVRALAPPELHALLELAEACAPSRHAGG